MSDWSPLADLGAREPGLVAGTLAGGAISQWRSFGSTAPLGEPLTSSSPLYVASLAKQFTAAAVGTLVLDGHLGLEDPVRRWLPELDPAWDPVRLHHLLSHTAGLPDGQAIDRDAGWGVDAPFSTWDRVGIITATAPESEPGMVHRYSNHGYVLLAAIVERATGLPLGRFAQQQLFKPAGMPSSRFLDVEGDAACPGWTAQGRRIDVQFSCVGDGGLVTTMEDLAHWNGWLPASRLAELMLTGRPVLPNGRTAHDAWGISIRTHHGLTIQSHGGSIDGYMATFVRFPGVNVAIVMLANTDRFGVSDFGHRAQRLVDLLLGDNLDRSRPPWTETHGQPLQD